MPRIFVHFYAPKKSRYNKNKTVNIGVKTINATKTKRISSETFVEDKNRSKMEENLKKQDLRTIERETRVYVRLAKNQMYRSECKLHEKERKKERWKKGGRR